MMKVLFAILIITIPVLAVAQEKDSLIIADTPGAIKPEKVDTLIKADTVVKRKHSPRQATIRSAIFPGLGQIYNKKYWKLPIVYTAIGIPVGLYFNNKTWYNRTRYALAVVASNTTNADSLAKVHNQLRPLVDRKAESSLLRYRNEFRKNMDYSILFTLLMWGLNIVDATVDGHLKGFNVTDDLSLKIKPTLLPGNNGAGISMVFTFQKNHSKTIPSLH